MEKTSHFQGKKILVVGGTGSIGSALTKELLGHDPSVIRVLSNDENALFEMQRELAGKSNLRFLLGDVRDEGRMRLAVRGVDIVFSAAALKHVPISEYNPFDVVKTNVIGTKNLLEAVLWEGIERFVFISSDKAVNPTSTMGASKLLCERLVAEAASYVGPTETVFSNVRFGNVLGSRGSVTHTFARQIAAGGPVTVTSNEMTRFIMALEEAVFLVLKAAEIARGGETFVLKMDAGRIRDLAVVMIDELAPRFRYDPKTVQIELIGVRPGEKLYEELMTEDEVKRSKSNGLLYLIPPLILGDRTYPGFHPAEIGSYSSKEAKMMDYEQLRVLVKALFTSDVKLSF